MSPQHEKFYLLLKMHRVDCIRNIIKKHEIYVKNHKIYPTERMRTKNCCLVIIIMSVIESGVSFRCTTTSEPKNVVLRIYCNQLPLPCNNYNNTRTSIARKSSGNRAQNRNKTKLLIMISLRGQVEKQI